MEPLLAALRVKLSGLLLPVLSHHPQLVVSAYVDGISVFVRDQMNVDNLSLSLDLYQKVSSAKVTGERVKKISEFEKKNCEGAVKKVFDCLNVNDCYFVSPPGAGP